MQPREMMPWMLQSFYHTSIAPLLLLAATLAFLARPARTEAKPAGFGRFQQTYLGVWALCVAADWLQGPYVYQLYSAYGFQDHQIAQLFVAGFASAMVFGCVAGILADSFGRKKCCMAYCMLYIVSCLSKHVNSYSVLMFGRVTGGMATALLFSCFECWMVSEHKVRHGFSGQLLSHLFGVKFEIMYSVAIASGLLAEFGAEMLKFQPHTEGSLIYMGGAIAPFDMAIGFLALGCLLIGVIWEENYGSRSELRNLADQSREALKFFFCDRCCAPLCLVTTCFEGAMFAFVFNWTPALTSPGSTPPLGIIFALFMMACMAGASAATLVSQRLNARVRLLLICLLGAAAFLAASVTAGHSEQLCFASFWVFEFCVGAYYPTIGLLKSELIPEHIRGTIYNLCRAPLNAVVICLLLTDLHLTQCFRICACLLFSALLAVGILPERGAFGLGEPHETTALGKKV